MIAFRYRPTPLVLSEPTAGLDPLSSSVFKAAVKTARDAGTTVPLTTHVVAKLAVLADDIAFLLDGAIRFAGPVPVLLELTRKTALEEALMTLMQSPLDDIPAAALSAANDAQRIRIVLEPRT